MESLLNLLEPIIAGAAGKFGVIAQIITFMGTSRFIMKPIMVAIERIIEVTPTEKDNEFWNKVKNHKVYKGFVFFCDWLLSIKLPKAPEQK